MPCLISLKGFYRLKVRLNAMISLEGLNPFNVHVNAALDTFEGIESFKSIS